MRGTPVKDLNNCSVKYCGGKSSVIVQKQMGEDKVMFGYCTFHSIISATFFPNSNRVEIRV